MEQKIPEEAEKDMTLHKSSSKEVKIGLNSVE